MNVATPAAAIRALAADDLDAVVALDAAAQGRPRRQYLERRLAAARREPALHAQFAAVDDGALAGCLLARVLEGEFGRAQRALRLELVGVRADRRGAGVGRALFDAAVAWARRHGCAEVRSLAHWRDHAIIGWFDALGFELAPERVLDSAVRGGAYLAGRDEPAAEPTTGDEPNEIDYGRTEALGSNDHERLARDGDVRAMTEADLEAIARIDRRITGADRRDYIAARLAEALLDSGVRVSLTARCEGQVAGYLMARADLGDYGRTEPVAVIDTIGVDPGYAHRGVGRALLSQLFANLGALRVETVETLVAPNELPLTAFLLDAGFEPAQRLVFVRPL